MKNHLAMVVFLGACGGAQKTTTVRGSHSPEAVRSSAPGLSEPSKEAVAHFCAQMATITRESVADVPLAQVQTVIARQMATAAEANQISDWATFEAWLVGTAVSERQVRLDRLIRRYDLQLVCRAVSPGSHP